MFAIYRGEHLTMARDIDTEELVVHLNDPSTVLDLGGHALVYSKLELIGHGIFELRNHGRNVRTWCRLMPTAAN